MLAASAAGARVVLAARSGRTLDGIVEQWLEPATAVYVEHGMPEPQARALARLGIAVTRGLLLDLLATGDREGTSAAIEAWIALTTPAPP